MEFQQSKTYQNLLHAYERELMTSTIFDLYNERAVSDGYIEISNIFARIARNEKEHARIFMRRLYSGVLPNTQQNLSSSSDVENENSVLYRDYANTAREEGFADLAALFNGIANIDLNHSIELYNQYNTVVVGEVFCKPEERLWICLQCGNIMGGLCAPKICPICGFPQGYYTLFVSPQ